MTYNCQLDPIISTQTSTSFWIKPITQNSEKSDILKGIVNFIMTYQKWVYKFWNQSFIHLC